MKLIFNFCLPTVRAIGLLLFCAALFAPVCGLRAATIGVGNVTTLLGPSFFVDDAVTGGGDAVVTQPTVGAYIRSFEGVIARNQGLTRVTLTGLGFAVNSNAAQNTATTVSATFTYLGADEALGGGDDVVVGTTSGAFVYTVAGEYAFAFDAPLAANLAITGTRFRIQIAPSKAGGGATLGLKTGALAYESFTGTKLSVAGFAAPLRVNLAKYQPVKVDSVAGQRLANYVTDGDAGNDNRWQSDNSGPHWAQVDFPFPVEVGSAQVFTGVDDASAQANFRLQYLSSGAWVDAPGGVVAGNTNVERNLVFTASVTASSFRIYSDDSTLRVRELALYPPNGPGGWPLGTDLSINLALLRPAAAGGKFQRELRAVCRGWPGQWSFQVADHHG